MTRFVSLSGHVTVVCLLLAASSWPSSLFAGPSTPHAPVALVDRSGQSVAASGAPVSVSGTCVSFCHFPQALAACCSHAETKGTVRPGGATPDPIRHLVEPASGQPVAWDERTSATAEINCFLCHLANPDNKSRIEEIQAGRSHWAATATLGKSAVATRSPSGWDYSITTRMVSPPRGGQPLPTSAAWVDVSLPASQNCGQCHGRVHSGSKPFDLHPTLADRETINTGQIFAPNWDVHTAHGVDCLGCHFLSAEPDRSSFDSADAPDHLTYDPRGLPRGGRRLGPSEPTALRCVDCHDVTVGHDWLPSKELHLAALSCEACHIPTARGPAMQSIDWTLPDAEGQPLVQWRGTEKAPGFSPTLLPRQETKGRAQLVPHNLITALCWVSGDSRAKPVRLDVLQAALLENGRLADELVDVLDTDGNKQITDDERALDSMKKVEAVRKRLIAMGVKHPHIRIDIYPHAMRHGVASTDKATRRCEICHAAKSRLSEPFPMADVAWEGFANFSSSDKRIAFEGTMEPDDQGRLVYKPNTAWAGLYVPGQSGPAWVDVIGGMALLAVLLGVIAHAGMRWTANSRRVDSTTTEEQP